MRMWDVVYFLCNLSFFVPELEIQWSLGKKRTLGTLNFHWSVPRPASPLPLFPSKTVQVEVLRVAYEEGSALGAATREKMAESPPSVGAAGANATPCVDGAHAKEAEPRLEDASGPMALTPRSLRGPGFTPSREVALDAVMSVPGSFNVVDLGTRELGLLGYPPSATLAYPLEASSGGVWSRRVRRIQPCTDC
jgi:hypothetical protein